jgi:DNA-binding CsgD family transcriptional regulator
MWGLYALVESVVAEGSAAREELRRSGATIQACNRGALGYADAVAAGRSGEDPSRLLDAAETAMSPLVWRRHHMRLLVAPSALEDGWGEPLSWLREALDYFAQRGDVHLARACRDRLRATGAPVPRQGRGDSAVPPRLRRLGVTSREMDVLLLVAYGLTNREAAERLVLSSRTVETHVVNLLSKTGVRNRAQLRDLLEE